MWGSLATAAGPDEGRGEVGRAPRLCAMTLWGYPVLWNLRHETRDTGRASPSQAPPTSSGPCISTPLRHTRSHADKPSRIVPGEMGAISARDTQREGRPGEAAGVIKSDLALDPPSQLQTGDLRRQVERTIGSLLLSEEWTCASVSACLFLDRRTPLRLWCQAHVCLSFLFSISVEKHSKI